MPDRTPANLDLALELFAAELGDGPPMQAAPQNAHAYADQVMTAAPHNPAPHKMDLALFEQSTRGDIASMRLIERSADAIVDRIMSNPHLGDIVAAARDRDAAVADMQRIAKDAGEMLRHRAQAIDALTAERDRLAGELETETYRADCASENNNGLRAERDRLAGLVRQWKVVAEGGSQSLADILALPGVRGSQLRAGAAEIARIQRAAIDAINDGGQ